MKLAEALIERGNLQSEIHSIQNRINENARVQEGDQVAEDPNELFSLYLSKQDRLSQLIKRINHTNSITILKEGMTLADALVERDKLRDIKSHINETIEASSIAGDRYSRSEIKFVRSIDVASYQEKMDRVSKKWRELDTKIQGLNWTVDLE